MNLKQAHYVTTIAQCGSITAAAKKLYVSQPSLSQMLRQIEDEIGLSLFDRSAYPFKVTYAGEVYLQAAQDMLRTQQDLDERLRQIRNEENGRLRLGLSVTRAMWVLPLVLPEFARQYPHVRLELTETGSAGLEALVRRGEIDLALAATESGSAGMAYELIEKETVGILAGQNTALAQSTAPGKPISFADAAQEQFVCLAPSHSARVIQDMLCQKYGISPRVLLQTDSLEVGRRVTLETDACMVLPDVYMDASVRQRGGVFFPLADYENHRHFYACYRKDVTLPRYARDFIRITEELLRQDRTQYGK